MSAIPSRSKLGSNATRGISIGLRCSISPLEDVIIRGEISLYCLLATLESLESASQSHPKIAVKRSWINSQKPACDLQDSGSQSTNRCVPSEFAEPIKTRERYSSESRPASVPPELRNVATNELLPAFSIPRTATIGQAGAVDSTRACSNASDNSVAKNESFRTLALDLLLPSSESLSRSRKLDFGEPDNDLATEVLRIKTSSSDTSCGNVLSTGRLFESKTLKTRND